MKLFELTGIKKYYNKTEFQLERLLGKFGIKFIAGGKYGRVFASPKWDYVVKMFNDDPYYLEFVNYAIAHPNKHYPKFIRKPLQMHRFTKRFKNSASKFWIVKIEKLTTLDKTKGKFVVDHLERTVQYWYNTKRFDNGGMNDYDKQRHEQDWTWATMPNGENQKVKMVDFVKMYPWMISLAEAWYNIFENIEEGSPDLHAGNFMQREDGTIVIIDPLWQGTNPMAEYQAYLDRESAGMMDDYDEPDVKGPAYIQKRQQAAIEATKALASQLQGKQEEFNDDIPF
jgi:hypothetical protein